MVNPSRFQTHAATAPRSPFSRDRQRKAERAALTHFAAHPDRSAVQLDELATERQAQAGPFLLRRARPDLAELLEDDALIFRGDTNPGVPHRYLHTSVPRRRLNRDPTPFRGELDRIRQEIQQDLLDLPLIRLDRGHSSVNHDIQYQLVAHGALADQDQCVRNRLW